MAEELQLSLARWRAGEWKSGRRRGRCDRIFRRSSGLRHAVGIGRRRRQLVARDSDLRAAALTPFQNSYMYTHSLSLTVFRVIVAGRYLVCRILTDPFSKFATGVGADP